jgi:hypothetical protein
MPQVLFDRPWKRTLWLALIAGLAYLPSAVQLTYYRDDWYYAYDALVGPAGVFRLMFAGDRPARGPFFELYQLLFGIAPLPYHLAMYAWRLGGGLATVWLFHLVWPRSRPAGWAAGLLFAIYPGFTWWVAGIEYQPMVASAALMVVSLALTAQALRLSPSLRQTLSVAGAIITGWIYLGLVEYAAGIELIRLGIIFLLISDAGAETFRHRLGLAIRKWLVYLIIPLGFAAWRFLIFTSQRRATDLGAQLGAFQGDPLTTGLHWFVNLLVSLINTTFSAWVVPLMNNFFSGSARDELIGFVLALAAAAISWFFLSSGDPNGTEGDRTQSREWPQQAMWLGLAGLLLGILPIIVANREIAFPNFSHYTLPASLGLALAATGGLFSLASSRTRAAAFCTLVLLSVMTHRGLGTNALREERIVAGFWQQMAWRAPSVAPGTTLLAYYPGLDYGDDTDIVWGPANFAYFRQSQNQLPVNVSVSALTADRTAINNVLLGHEPVVSTYRSHTMTLDYASTLIIIQSAEDSCVRVIDPRSPTSSATDDPALRLLASASTANRIGASSASPLLPASIFGSEPPHGWCYYYEKAALAAQGGNWQEVAALQNDVGKLGLHPNDQIEWMPFLQAQAYLGDQQALKQIATRINTEKLYKQQACLNLKAMADQGYPLPMETQALVDALFCGAQQ